MIENQTMKAVLWMLGAMFSLFTLGLLGKFLATDFDSFEIMFYRSVLAFFFFCAFTAATGHFRDFRIRNLPLHLARNISHFTAQTLWFYALATLSLAVVVTFEFTTPSWVIIISAFVLGEGFGWRRALVIALSLLGIFMITDPRYVPLNGPLIAAILCAIGFAITMLFTKQLTKIQNVYEIIFMMTLLQGLFAAIIIALRMDLALPTLANLPWLIVVAFFGTTSHYCMTRALALAEASTLSPIDLLRLPLSVIAGWMLFGEKVTWLMVLGSGFLILANYINIRRKAKPGPEVNGALHRK